ncbi:MAG: cobalamin-dependent protein [Syntrophobacteraceae bacterium]
MRERKIRIMMGKFGEGYDSSVMRLAGAFSEAGFEVIYTELQDPEAIVASAIQESVDHIGITTLPGANIELFSSIIKLLKKEGRKYSGHIRISAGGAMEDDDIARLKKMGVVEFFPIGTSYEELIQWAKDNIKHTEHHP